MHPNSEAQKLTFSKRISSVYGLKLCQTLSLFFLLSFCKLLKHLITVTNLVSDNIMVCKHHYEGWKSYLYKLKKAEHTALWATRFTIRVQSMCSLHELVLHPTADCATP